MTIWTRRTVLGSIGGAAAAFAGCFEGSRGSGFKGTEVEGQELVVEFDERLEPDAISVVDPDGEAFAETSVSAGVTRETFEISMPYTPGEYRIIATQGGEEVAEATQEIEPELEIVNVGVGANRTDEMPEELGNTKEVEALVAVENSGTGPEFITQLSLDGDLPSNRDQAEERTGIFDPERGGEAQNGIPLESGEDRLLFTSTLPFTFEGDGINCREEPQSGEFIVSLEGSIGGTYSQKYDIRYSSAGSYDGCDIEVSEG